jgi:tetratricopeptide (TPR) repeat protein
VLVACPSCGKRISNRVPSCPFCKAKTGYTAESPADTKDVPPPAATAAAVTPAPATPAVARSPASAEPRFREVKRLGEGGLGPLHLVLDRVERRPVAMRTIREDLWSNPSSREALRKEVRAWVDLPRHPYVVRATLVEESQGQPRLALDYVAPDERGLNTLEGALKKEPPDLGVALRWAVQCCAALEHAFARGLHRHGNLKPSNILIGVDGAVRVTDLAMGEGMGTPTHMPPERFDDRLGGDERSDIYSFGVVLYQMASGGALPFPPPPWADDPNHLWIAMRERHHESSFPRLDSLLAAAVDRCLHKEPDRRYPTFKALRADLEDLLKRETGQTFRLPTPIEQEGWELANRGFGLHVAGAYEDALAAFDKALGVLTRPAAVHLGRGRTLGALHRLEEAVSAFDKAIGIDPHYAAAWNRKGGALVRLGRDTEAIDAIEQAVVLDPRETEAWMVLGYLHGRRNRLLQALPCYDRVIAAQPDFASAWFEKASVLAQLGRGDDAIAGFERFLELAPAGDGQRSEAEKRIEELRSGVPAVEGDGGPSAPAPSAAVPSAAQPATAASGPPPSGDDTQPPGAFFPIAPRPEDGPAAKGLVLAPEPPLEEEDLVLRPTADAFKDIVPAEPKGRMASFEASSATEPENAQGWNARGAGLFKDGRYAEALLCFDAALSVDPRNAAGWNNKANCFFKLGQHDDALLCHEKALEIEPLLLGSWLNRSTIEREEGRGEEALRSLHQFLSLAPADEPGFAQARDVAARLEARGIRPAAPTGLVFMAEGAQRARRGQLTEALHSFDEAVRLAPRLATAWLGRGDVLTELDRVPEALESYEGGLGIDRGDARLWTARGHALARAQRLEEAVSAFERAADADPTRADAWTARGRALGTLGRTEEAIASLEKAIALDANAAAPWLRKAVIQERAGASAEAALSYTRFIELATPDLESAVAQARARLLAIESAGKPASPSADAPPVPPGLSEAAEAWTTQGLVALNAGHVEEALALFDQTLNVTVGAAPVWRARGDALRALGKTETALASYDEALRLAPEDVASWNRRGEILDGLGRKDDAHSCFERAVAIAPEDPDALFNLAFAEDRRNRVEEVVRLLRRFMAVAPAHPKLRRERAGERLQALTAGGSSRPVTPAQGTRVKADADELVKWATINHNQGQFAKALEGFEEALAADGAHAAAWVGKGDTLISLDRAPEALACFDKALARTPRDPGLWIRKGDALESVGRAEDALACYDRALELHPRHPAAWNCRGQGLARLGRFTEALPCFERALELDPRFALARFNKAGAEEALGRPEDAMRSFQAFLSFAPPYLQAQIDHAKARLAELKQSAGR